MDSCFTRLFFYLKMGAVIIKIGYHHVKSTCSWETSCLTKKYEGIPFGVQATEDHNRHADLLG